MAKVKTFFTQVEVQKRFCKSKVLVQLPYSSKSNRVKAKI